MTNKRSYCTYETSHKLNGNDSNNIKTEIYNMKEEETEGKNYFSSP